MELFIPFQSYAPASLFGVVFFLYFMVWRKRNTSKRQPPEPSGSLPIIGHLSLLGSSVILHKALANLADKYGPIFRIRIGSNRVLVISNSDMAQECLANGDKVFVNRPQTLGAEQLTYNFAMLSFSLYGPYWREIRKISTIELLSKHRLEKLKHGKVLEVRSAMKALHDKWEKTPKHDSSNGISVDMKQWFGDINLNVIAQLIAGKTLVDANSEGQDEYDHWKSTLREGIDLIGIFVVADALPFLRWFDVGGYEKRMKRVAKELDDMMQRWLEEHKRDHKSGEGYIEQDFMHILLNILSTSNGKLSGFDSDTIIKATCLLMIYAGSDTTTVTLTWALSLLLNNHHVLRKVKDELDAHVGNQRQVDVKDTENLVYLQAVIKETMRLYPAAPLLLPRQAINDCEISGFHVSAGTQLFINAYKIQRDPKVWPDPNEFRPERFLTTHKDIDVTGKNFELIPFGSGRRVCPGLSFALQIIQFTLASLLHEFEITTPSNEPVDMTESSGLTNPKSTPLIVTLTPRAVGAQYSM